MRDNQRNGCQKEKTDIVCIVQPTELYLSALDDDAIQQTIINQMKSSSALTWKANAKGLQWTPVSLANSDSQIPKSQ